MKMNFLNLLTFAFLISNNLVARDFDKIPPTNIEIFLVLNNLPKDSNAKNIEAMKNIILQNPTKNNSGTLIDLGLKNIVMEELFKK